MLFNVNHYVLVRLTDVGRALIETDPLKAAVHRHRSERDGWTEWQMWELMSWFGKHVYNGCRPPFETTIEIVEEQPLLEARKVKRGIEV